MKTKGIKSFISSKVTVICTVGFLLTALLVAADEIWDIPANVFKAPPTPINWTEIGIEVFFIFLVGALVISLVSKLESGSKRAEEALKQWSEELEQKSRELADANVRLEELSRHKSQFLANMSHELRTPLNSIIGYTKLVLDGLEGEISEEQRKDLQTVYSNSQHLLALINDLLDLSKIEAGKVTVSNEVFTINELLDEVIPSICSRRSYPAVKARFGGGTNDQRRYGQKGSGG